MPRIAAICILLASALLSGWAGADEVAIKRTLQSRFPTMNVERVSVSPFPGLYEVVLDGEIVYTDAKAQYFFSGNIFDIRTLPPRNLTEDSSNRIAADAFTRARELAIKRVRGNGARTLFTFEDPNCGY